MESVVDPALKAVLAAGVAFFYKVYSMTMTMTSMMRERME